MTSITTVGSAPHWMDDPAPVTAAFATLYRRLQAAYMEAQARATTQEQQRMWHHRSRGAVGFLETLDTSDALVMLDAVAVLRDEYANVTDIIATQIAVGPAVSAR